jgi:aspartyl-tRNA synthetase
VFFVVDFPLFEQDEDTGALFPAHHPFVAPNPDDVAAGLLETAPERARAWCYDLVMNGNELMSGSVRIHDAETQARIFALLNLTPEQQQEKFGFLLNAFRYGAPPHAGCAFGLDRWVMLFAGADTLRDVIAYPKNSAGRDLMLDAPAPVEPEQLKELGIRY